MDMEIEHENAGSASPGMLSPTRTSVKEKCQPVFRVVEAYDKRHTKAGDESGSTNPNPISEEESVKRGDLFAEVTGPVWHKISNPMVTPPIIAENLSLKFKDLPVFGAPECAAKLREYEDKRVREFVGADLDDTEFDELKLYCDPDHLKTGKELKMITKYPVAGLISKNKVKEDSDGEKSSEDEHIEKHLVTLKRIKRKQTRDGLRGYSKLLKYRGIKQFPLNEQEDSTPGMDQEPPDLEPGKDVLYHIRVYRPFSFHYSSDKRMGSRHSVFESDIVVPGRQPLTALRDQFSCRNDLDIRLDKSHKPDDEPIPSAKVVFPSGFLFINNVFYVDGRAGCRDTSAAVRGWARTRGLGDFPVRAMERCSVAATRARLATPEVYVHQGNCEHMFMFSEVRLLSRSDPLHLSAYPCHTKTSQNQSIYCATCADFGAKWLVTGSDRVPFDPAFFCEVCFKEYLYINGKKIGDFKAYAYRGNEMYVRNPRRLGADTLL